MDKKWKFISSLAGRPTAVAELKDGKEKEVPYAYDKTTAGGDAVAGHDTDLASRLRGGSRNRKYPPPENIVVFSDDSGSVEDVFTEVPVFLEEDVSHEEGSAPAEVEVPMEEPASAEPEMDSPLEEVTSEEEFVSVEQEVFAQEPMFFADGGAANEGTFKNDDGEVILEWSIDSKGTLTISGEGEIPRYAFEKRTDFSKVVIEAGITSIGFGAFRSCMGLTSVTIPAGVISIRDWAFESCTGLTSVTIPDGVISIGFGAFSDCEGLASVTIPDSVISIDTWAFRGCTSLVTVEASTGLLEGTDMSAVFRYTPWLTEYYKKDTSGNVGSLTWERSDDGTLTIHGPGEIPDNAFAYHAEFSKVVIEEGVTSIGPYAFQGCTSLVTVEASSGLLKETNVNVVFQNTPWLPEYYKTANSGKVGDLTWERAGDETLIICGQGEMPYYAFMNRTDFSKVVIEEGVTSIAYKAFSNCTGLTSVTIPSSVTSIDTWAFSNCTGLTSVEIPDSVRTIDVWAFLGCTSLTSVAISEELLDAIDINEVFMDTPWLANGGKPSELPSNPEPEAPSTPSDTKPGESTAQTTPTPSLAPTAAPAQPTPTPTPTAAPAPTKLKVGQTFTEKNVKYQVKAGNVLTVAGGSKNAKTLSIPAVVKKDGVSYKVTSVKDNAFKNYKKLQKVTVGKEITKIGKNAFSGCAKLKTVTIQTTKLKSVGKNAFKGIQKKAAIKVPKKQYAKYVKYLKASKLASSVTIKK